MRSEVLKGHLDALLLATLEPGPRHGFGVADALRTNSVGQLDLRPARCIRRCTASSAPGS
jgi:PadR family transcriptional regulator PadR